MPQMMPMNWFTLMIYFILIYFMIIMILTVTVKLKLVNLKNLMKLYNKIYKKWY